MRFRSARTSSLRRHLAAVVLIGLTGFSLSTAANGPPVTLPGILAGQANVSATGGFTYNIPIAVPPGTAGMAPSIFLNYSSQNGDGIIGLGWSLGGLSTITRCPRTYAQDTVHGGVNYDMNDRYCLDGARLILVSGTYGVAGSVYRSEIDGFSKITANGSAGNGPAWFQVQLRTGQVLQYGSTTSSQILAVGSTTARAWALNQLADTKGNYYTVTYTNDTTNGQFYPSQINYTGNASASLTPYNSVQFAYTTRPDIVPTYQAGSLQQTTVLLTDIKTYNGATLVFDYKLAYALASSNASHDELDSVTQCDGVGNCLAPTTFGWQGSRDRLTMTSTAVSIAQGVSPGRFAPGDYNGDGLTDVAFGTVSLNSIAVYLGTATAGTFSLGSTNTVENNPWTLVPLDFNGDGLTDLDYLELVPSHPGFAPTSILYQATGAGNFSIVYPAPISTGLIWSPWGDYNGDGLSDGLQALTSGTEELATLSNGDGTFGGAGGPTYPTGTGVTFFTAGDFDGDGCTDLITQGTPSAITYSCNPATSSVTIPNWSSAHLVFGDFNGDGKTDILVVTSTGATLYLSTGTGLAAGIAISGSSTWFDYAIVAGDFNGDGKADLLLVASGAPSYYGPSTSHQIWLSIGAGFMQAENPSGGFVTIANTSSLNGGCTGACVTPQIADWNNDGAQDIWLEQPSGDAQYLFAYTPELMTTVSNNIGAMTTVTYSPINANQPLYTKCPSAPTSYVCSDTYPTQALDGAYYVVSAVSSSNGIGGGYAHTYAYSGMARDMSGRGNLGFAQTVSTDSQTGLVTTTNYSMTFPYTGLVTSQTVTSGSTTLKSAVNTYTSTNEGSSSPGAAFYFVSLQQSVASGADLDGAAFPSSTTSYAYDSYGNALTKTVSVSDGSSQVTTNTYNNNTSSWFLGQLLTSQTQSITGSSNLTRHFSYSYDPTSGLLTQTVVEPGNTALSYTTVIGYDAYGNKTSTTVSGSGITTRSTGTTYDSLGEFAITATNALSQSDQFTYSPAFGETLTHTDPNSIESSATYDTFGRLATTTKPDGNQIVMSYLYCSSLYGGGATCPAYGAYLVQSTPENSSGVQNGAASIAYYDALGRIIGKDVQGFDGSWIRVSTSYNANGQVAETSRPYFVSGGTPIWTTCTYDALGRATLGTLPNGRQSTYTYNGMQKTASTTIVSGTISTVETQITTLNAQGLPASVKDASSNTTSYVYDAFGNLLTATDPAGNVVTNTFDLRGRKTASSDPDMGNWSYTYDVLSELTSQTSPNEAAASESTTLTYDLLGRPTTRIDPDMSSQWQYDTITDGIGQLAHACNDDPCHDSTYEQTPSYDSFGRPVDEKLKRNGTNFDYLLTYNSDGRIATVTYPSGFVAKYVYNSLGYLSQIVNNSTGTTYWTANTRDAELHLLQATAGNGVVTTQSFDPDTGGLDAVAAGPSDDVANFSYTWDTGGNLASRADTFEGYTENFCYDALNRLTNYAINGSGSTQTALCTSGTTNTVKSVSYDALGDILTKSDVGTYTYPSAGSAHPHAVSSINNATGCTLVSPEAPCSVRGTSNPTFTYDPNGNMTAGPGLAVAWTTYNMPATVTQGTTSLAFLYNGNHDRIQECAPNCTSPTTTTYYLNDPASGAMEEEVVSGSTTIWHDYIIADGGIVAELFKTGSTTTPIYINSDHLGSASVLANASGTVTERDSYDAWGKRRNPNGIDNPACAITSQTTRGYTDQEMMDSVCAVNLNARIYDPSVARIMSPDTMVANPLNGQSFNRYSYVENRPLSAIDPSGHVTAAPNPNIVLDGPPCWACSGAGDWGVANNGDVITAGEAQFAMSGGVTPSELAEYSFAGAVQSFGTFTLTVGGISQTFGPGQFASGIAWAEKQGAINAGFTGSTGPSNNWWQYDATFIFNFPQFGIRLTNWAASYGVGQWSVSGTNGQWYGPTSKSVGGAGVLSSLGEYGSGAATIGTNLRLYRGWNGNQYVDTFKLAESFHNLGTGLTVAGAGFDIYAYNLLPNHGGLTLDKLQLNLSVDLISFAGPGGAAFAAGYYLTDTFYPGGVEGLGKDYSNSTTGQAQALTQQVSPMSTAYLNGSAISFHPKTTRNAPIQDRTRKPDRGVIDPYDLPEPHQNTLRETW